VAEVGDRGRPEGALGALQEEVVGTKGGEDEAHVLQVLCPRRAVDENVIEENQHEPMEEWTEDVVHRRLECCRGVGKPERHHQELEVAWWVRKTVFSISAGCMRT
jgi:hypothetical protein